MADLIAKTPLAGCAPVTIGAATLSEIDLGRITSLAPFEGRDKSLARALKALGLGFPPPNRVILDGSARLVWTGRAQAFLIGPDATALAPHAALTDQSDGWAGLGVEGQAAEAVLARLLPLDLRVASFAVGHAARAPLNHMSSVLMRVAPLSFEILVFRSMARTAWHEVEQAMTMVAARAALARHATAPA